MYIFLSIVNLQKKTKCEIRTFRISGKYNDFEYSNDGVVYTFKDYF